MAQFRLASYEDAESSIPSFGEIEGTAPHCVSVLIGPNGSGKSRVLARIAEELTYLDASKRVRLQLEAHPKGVRKAKPPSDRMEIKYAFGNALYSISRSGDKFRCEEDGRSTSFLSVPFPNRLAVLSQLPTDKFRFQRNEASDFYRYLGLRQASNLTTTGAQEAKVIQNLVRGFTIPQFAERLKAWFKLMKHHGEPALTIGIPANYLDRSIEEFRSLVLDRKSVRGPSEMNMEEEISHAWEFLAELRDTQWMERGNRYLTIRIPDLSQGTRGEIWARGLEASRKLRLFRHVSLIIGTQSGHYPFSELSSGEQQLLTTCTSLLTEIEPCSLIIIDEPEVSLHPEWQMRYVPTLLESLRDIDELHILIATHSHFIVSDLDDQNSSVIVASNDDKSDKQGEFKVFDGDVYGRSPENILYRVFGVATAGNVAIEGDLYAALSMISGSAESDFIKLREIQTRLERATGPDNPAMNEILEQIREFSATQT